MIPPRTRGGGGIGSVHTEFSKHRVTEMKPRIQEAIWLKFLTDNEETMLLAFMYIPHGEKEYHDPMRGIREGLLRVPEGSPVLIMGDMNARIGGIKSNQVDDFPVQFLDECLEEVEFDIKPKCRMMEDEKSNAYGRELIKICQDRDLEILNGSSKGDTPGRMTCYSNPEYPSTNDLAILSGQHREIVLREILGW